jgi:hypothetical protein
MPVFFFALAGAAVALVNPCLRHNVAASPEIVLKPIWWLSRLKSVAVGAAIEGCAGGPGDKDSVEILERPS